MEEIKNGVISEKALDEIAGGLKLPKLTVKNIFLSAGITISAIAGAIAGGSFAYAMTPKVKESKTRSDGIGELKNVDMKQFQNLFNE